MTSTTPVVPSAPPASKERTASTVDTRKIVTANDFEDRPLAEGFGDFTVLGLLAFLPFAIGCVAGAWLGEPADWPDVAPNKLVLASGLVVALFVLIFAWKDEVEDRATASHLERAVKLAASPFLMGAALGAISRTSLEESWSGRVLASVVAPSFVIGFIAWAVFTWAVRVRVKREQGRADAEALAASTYAVLPNTKKASPAWQMTVPSRPLGGTSVDVCGCSLGHGNEPRSGTSSAQLAGLIAAAGAGIALGWAAGRALLLRA